MIQTLSDVGSANKVTNKMDGAVYSLFGDCIIGGVGNEFSETHQNLTMTIKSGEAVLGGHFYKITGTETITLTQGTGYVCLSIDTTRANGSRGYLTFKALDDVKKENINDIGTLRDFILYKVVATSNSITSVSDVRVIRSGLDSNLGGYTLVVYESAQAFEDSKPHSNNQISFVKE